MTINNNEQKQVCRICGEIVNPAEGIGYEVESGFYCEDCAGDNLAWCDRCETWHDHDEMCEVRVPNYARYGRYATESWCEACVYNYAARCDECDDLFSTDCDLTEVDDFHTVCHSCLEEYYRHCDECDEWVRWTDYDDECDLCRECAASGAGLITRYHGANAAHPKFYADGETPCDDPADFIGGGCEIEVDREERNTREERECVKELNALLGERAIFERDGSLRNGFEIVTRPHTLRAWAQDFPLDEVLEICRRHGYKAHDIKTCGFHLHISRRYFGIKQAAQERAIGKCIAFYDRFYDDIVKASRRDTSQARNWAQRVPAADMADARKKAKWEDKDHDDRYAAVNTVNCATVEFRIMRGTLNAATLRACYDFLLAIARNAKRCAWETATANPAEMLKGIKPATREYLARRGAFVEWLEDIKTASTDTAEEVK